MKRSYHYFKMIGSELEYVVIEDKDETMITSGMEFDSNKVFEISVAINEHGQPCNRVVRLDQHPLIGPKVKFNESNICFESELDQVKNSNAIKMIEQTNEKISTQQSGLVLS